MIEGMQKHIPTVTAAILALVAIFISLWVSAALTRVEVAVAPKGEIADFQVPCRGPWNGVQITQSQLDKVLTDHQTWLRDADNQHLQISPRVFQAYEPVVANKTEEHFAEQGFASPMPPSIAGGLIALPDAGRADLCGARITGLDFHQADLRYARLMGARIYDSNMGGVDLRWADLKIVGMKGVSEKDAKRQGTFFGAVLNNALIYDSDFHNIDLSNASLRFADIGSTNFAEVNFDHADLSATKLTDVDLTDALLTVTNLTRTIINIRPGHLPQAQSLRDAVNLTSVAAFGGAETSLAELRDKLDTAKLALPAAEINYALNNISNAYEQKEKDSDSYPLQRQLNWLLLGVTYAYGLRPERLLLIGAIVAFLFSFFYLAAILQREESAHALWLVRTAPLDSSSAEKPQPIRLRVSNCNPYVWAVWFSVLSAFRIGSGNINVGEWISRLQPSDVQLAATGWPRTVSGMQSLLSVYLLALAISKYLL